MIHQYLILKLLKLRQTMSRRRGEERIGEGGGGGERRARGEGWRRGTHRIKQENLTSPKRPPNFIHKRIIPSDPTRPFPLVGAQLPLTFALFGGSSSRPRPIITRPRIIPNTPITPPKRILPKPTRISSKPRALRHLHKNTPLRRNLVIHLPTSHKHNRRQHKHRARNQISKPKAHLSFGFGSGDRRE
jgi:hypothetical protein